MKTYDFIALDVETACNSPRFICQIGLAYVLNNKIVKTESYLVQPPGNKISPITSKIHHILMEDTVDQPLFPEIWSLIREDIINNKVVAHNSSFDNKAIQDNLDHYNILDNIGTFYCTYKIFGFKLESLCYGFNIEYTNHHDACFDAKCCALFYLNHLNNIAPDYTKMPPKKTTQRVAGKSPLPQKYSLKNVSPNLNANVNNPFYNKKVVLTGVFSADRSDLISFISELGAVVKSSISGLTDIVLKGNDAGPAKLKKIDELQAKGKCIEVIEEEELIEIFSKWDN